MQDTVSLGPGQGNGDWVVQRLISVRWSSSARRVTIGRPEIRAAAAFPREATIVSRRPECFLRNEVYGEVCVERRGHAAQHPK